MNEPSTKQQCYNIPIFIKKGDFTCDDNNVHCGFASLGNGKVDYKNCLMKVTFRPDLEKKFKLVRSEVLWKSKPFKRKRFIRENRTK